MEIVDNKAFEKITNYDLSFEVLDADEFVFDDFYTNNQEVTAIKGLVEYQALTSKTFIGDNLQYKAVTEKGYNLSFLVSDRIEPSGAVKLDWFFIQEDNGTVELITVIPNIAASLQMKLGQTLEVHSGGTIKFYELTDSINLSNPFGGDWYDIGYGGGSINLANFTLLEGATRDSFLIGFNNPLKWKKTGFRNTKRLILNETPANQTIAPINTPLEFFLGDNLIGSNIIGLINIDGLSVQISGIDVLGFETFSESIPIVKKESVDWHDFFFGSATSQNQIIRRLPINTVRFIFNILPNAGESAKIGKIVFGKAEYIGDVEYGAGVEIKDFSIKQEDADGNTYLEKKRAKDINNLGLSLDTPRFDRVTKILRNIRATPTLFLGTEEIESFQIYGIYKKFQNVYKSPKKAKINLQVESFAI